MGYFVWFYPVVSMTFVQREVAALRERGVEVLTMAVRHPPHILSALEQRSADETWTIGSLGRARTATGTLRAWVRSPVKVASALFAALQEGWHRGGATGIRQHIRYFFGALLLAEHLRREKIDHLHVHMGDVAADVARIVARVEDGRRRKQPFTWSMTIHGPDELLHAGRYRLRKKIASADFVVAVSQYGRAQLAALARPEDWEKLHVVHCGLDLARWPVRPVEPVGEVLQVLCVGRLQPQKAHRVLIEAAALLRSRGVPFQLTIVGDGPDRADLAAAVTQHGLANVVDLAGPVGQDAVADLFMRFDIFCLASVSEGLPVVLMEAMASGLPTVTTRITGVPELIQDGVSGLLVPPARADALADALERLHADPTLRAELVVGAQQSVRAGFDVNRSAERLEQLFREVRLGLRVVGRSPAVVTAASTGVDRN